MFGDKPEIISIDLAGSVNNPTGIYFLKDAGLEFKILNCDEDILKTCFDFKPDIISIDAPIIDGIQRIRKADGILKKYKALPPDLPGMKKLTIRGSKLAKKLSVYYKVIEVFPTATAKILGIYCKNYKEMVEKLDLKIKNKHELDAYLCCLTARLLLEKKAVQIGDGEGKITIPK